jgi:diguanylate cyclase (GGDEF)-like protein
MTRTEPVDTHDLKVVGVDDDGMSSSGTEEWMDKSMDDPGEYGEDRLVDQLTGIGNRWGLYRELEQRLSQYGGTSAGMALFLLDLDHFRLINDRYGVQVGDQILLAIARRLRDLAEPAGRAYRIGGEAFVVVPSDVKGRTEAIAFGKRVVETVHAPLTASEFPASPPHLEGERITASVGIASWTTGMMPDDLLRNADRARYAAKGQRAEPGSGDSAILFDDLPPDN